MSGSDLSEILDNIRDYKQYLKDRQERAKQGEKVDGREYDMVDLAHLSGKISGLDAAVASLQERLDERNAVATTDSEQ